MREDSADSPLRVAVTNDRLNRLLSWCENDIPVIPLAWNKWNECSIPLYAAAFPL